MLSFHTLDNQFLLSLYLHACAYACETMQQKPYVLKTFLWAVMDFRDGYTEQKINSHQ